MVRKSKRSPTDGFSKAEYNLLAKLLFEASEATSDDVDIEYPIPATEENKDLMRSFAATLNKGACQDVLEEIEDAKDEIICSDFMLYEYFAKRCKKLGKID